jgi:transcriptional regulator with GAF, ATPase, and Fis domain
MSKRQTGPFVAVDCTTLPESLVESELFGHVKGAFTGATVNRTGWFETAHKGTLFLDEIGNLSLSVQAKLLRTLQESTIAPVGSRTPRRIDVRLISATNVDLEKAVADGAFRADLYYRLSTVPVRIPPLRQRDGDIPILVHHFLKLYNERYGKNVTEVDGAAFKILCGHSWPGNVRELENVIKSAIFLAQDRITERELVPYLLKPARAVGHAESAARAEPKFTNELQSNPGAGIDLKKIRQEAAEEAEKNVIQKIIGRSASTQSELAKLLGVDRKTLRLKLKKLGIGFKKHEEVN